MQFCTGHWAALRKAIDDRGLSHLIASSDQYAHARMVAELEGRATDATYDPLMAAHNMVVTVCLDWIGLALMFGDLCPVCEVLKPDVYPPIPEGFKYASNESYFIDGPADAALDYCRAHQLAH